MRRRPIPTRAAVLSMLVLVGTPLAACAGGGEHALCSAATPEPLNPALNHVLVDGAEPVYTTDPPTSGPHAPGALPKGVLTEPLTRPTQVGALEAGVVLLQYRDLSANEVRSLSALVTDNVVVAPNPTLPDKVVATAWLFKQTCSGVETTSLKAFIRVRAGHGPGNDG
jgi:hypothetical protein